jgi:O-succinylbenzoic acid--CoA ligase
VFFTSGTTGKPKAALLSARAIEAGARAVLARIGVDPEERWLCALPLAHVGGFSILARALISRKTIVLGALERATIASFVPAMLHRLLEAEISPALRLILLGGAPASPALLARARAAGLTVAVTYGLTETCAAAAIDGVLLDGVELHLTRTHAIELRGPSLFSGYAGSPPRAPDDWFDTGDLGALDAAGRLVILSRRTDLIITGGENVYPAEIEAALESNAQIERACVFGLDDEVWGQLVCAAVIPRSGGVIDRDRLAADLRATLAPFKRPRRIAIVGALPESAPGKLDRASTRERFRDSLGRFG